MIAQHFTRRWQKAGLIDEALARRIIEWESAHRRPVLLWAAAGTGTLAVLLGIMAIIGANWDDIPAWLKLAVDLALNAAAAATVFVFWQRQRLWLREICALLLFGLVLSGIALIGQVDQLQSESWRALALWLVISTPFLALVAFTRLTGVLWAIAVVTTWFMADRPIADALAWVGVVPARANVWQLPILLPLMSYIIACAMIVVSAARARWSRSESQAGLLLKLSLAGLIAVCSFAISFDFYGRDRATLGPIAMATVVTLPAAVALWRSRMDIDPRFRLGLPFASLAVWVIGLLLAARNDMTADVLRALLFIFYWGAIGAIAAYSGWRGWFGFAFIMIALRLLILYFQAIGGLTATGFGLIGGGVLCLALAAVGWRLRRAVRRPEAAT